MMGICTSREVVVVGVSNTNNTPSNIYDISQTTAISLQTHESKWDETFPYLIEWCRGVEKILMLSCESSSDNYIAKCNHSL
jgi:hypothetical protein